MPLTHARFSMLAAYLASRSASWAAECVDLPEQVNQPMQDDSVKRFVKMLRDRADHIETLHNSSEQ